MTRPVINTTNNYNQYSQNISNRVTTPVIDGYFPKHKTYKDLVIARVNKTLCAILTLFILVSAISYYFVTSSEITLNKYRKQALALNDENVELQNKLDYLKSYYNVDQAMQKQHLLQKAKNVMEVKGVPVNTDIKTNKLSTNQRQNSYQWSIGF